MVLTLTFANRWTTNENLSEKMLMKQFRKKAIDNILSRGVIKRLNIKEKFHRNGDMDGILTFDFASPDEWSPFTKKYEKEYADNKTEFSDAKLALLSKKTRS